MTIYGSWGSTPLNYSGFQGTNVGNPVGATNTQLNPAVGLFPPNSNNQSGDSLLAATSRGAYPMNAQSTTLGSKDSRPGRSVGEAMADAGARGYGGTISGTSGYDALNSDANGGSGPGAGQSNQTEGPTSGEFSAAATPMPATSVTLNGQYQG